MLQRKKAKVRQTSGVSMSVDANTPHSSRNLSESISKVFFVKQLLVCDRSINTQLTVAYQKQTNSLLLHFFCA